VEVILLLLIIDNYDSFVYNIVQTIDYPEEFIKIVRNDQFTLSDIAKWQISHIIISPGPMSPSESGLSNDVIKHYGNKIPILGICLGHQCIGHSFNCKVDKHPIPTHGRHSTIKLDQSSKLFKNLPQEINVARYHSLFVEQVDFNHEDLLITSNSLDGTIMSIEHKKYPIYGVQFHPESILTGSNGKQILKNFINL
jgi:anthranilate synthase component 2